MEKKKKKRKFNLVTGTILVGSIIIIGSVSVNNYINEKRQFNADQIISCEFDRSTNEKIEHNIENYFNEVNTVKSCYKKGELYKSDTALVAFGDEIRSYLVKHEINDILVGDDYFSAEGTKFISQVETPAIKQETHYIAPEGYVLKGNKCIKIEGKNSIKYSDLDGYALGKYVYVYYDNKLDTTPSYIEQYCLVKLNN